jgi:hypothetical protein
MSSFNAKYYPLRNSLFQTSTKDLNIFGILIPNPMNGRFIWKIIVKLSAHYDRINTHKVE